MHMPKTYMRIHEQRMRRKARNIYIGLGVEKRGRDLASKMNVAFINQVDTLFSITKDDLDDEIRGRFERYLRSKPSTPSRSFSCLRLSS